MGNPMLQQLRQAQPQTGPNLDKIKSLFRVAQNAGNPAAMLQTMLSQNPQMRQAFDFVNQSGGDPQKAFYALAKQKGVDPEEVLSALRS